MSFIGGFEPYRLINLPMTELKSGTPLSDDLSHISGYFHLGHKYLDRPWIDLSNTTWQMHIIDDSSLGADGVKLADINHDGLPDIVTGWEEGGNTRLYLNPGKTQIKNKWPSVTVGQTPSVEDAVFADLDSDGKLDIISCTENKSEKIFVHWNLRDEHLRVDNWKQEVLPASKDQMMWMYAEPLQLDDQFGVDLIAAGKGPNASIGWFKAPRDGRKLDEWTWHQISPVGWIMSICFNDMDADGDQDIIITDRKGVLQACRWLENPGPGKSQEDNWKSHTIGGKGLEVMFMTMSDLDNDGHKEIMVSERTEESIRVYRQSAFSGMTWDEQIIYLPSWTGHAKAVEVGDVNGDDIPDFIVSTNTDNHDDKYGLIWLDGRQTSQAAGADFQAISTAHQAKYDRVELMDLDNDGDLDILICEENFGENSKGLGVIWYENVLRG